MSIIEPMEIHPRVRGLAALLAIVGTLTVTSVLGAALAWIVVVLLLAVNGRMRKHLKFVLTFVLPISCALFVVWWGIVGAPPGKLLRSAPGQGAAFAGLVSLRLALLGGLSQISLTTIKPHRLVSTLVAWGLKGELLVITVSAMTLVEEIKLRGEQVLTARYARGFVQRRSFVSDLMQLPFILRPLLAWVLRAAVQRGEVWEQRGLLKRMSEATCPEGLYSPILGAFYLALAASWFLFAMVTRFA